jgi:hypothetical protein
MPTLVVVLLAAVLGVGLTCASRALRKRLGGHLIVALLLLLTAASATALGMRWNELTGPPRFLGGLQLTAGPGTSLHVGKLVIEPGSTQLLSWQYLLSSQPQLDGVAALISGDLQKIDAEELGGAGAVFAAGSPGSRGMMSLGAGGGPMGRRVVCGHRQVLVKRADGQYDLILLVDLDIYFDGQRRPLHLVIRPRSSTAVLPPAAVVAGTTTSNDRVDINLNFQTGTWFIPISEEAKKKGFFGPE